MKRLILILFMFAFFAEFSSAQGFMRPMWRQRILEFKKVRLLEILKLDEQTSVKFLSRYSKFSDDLAQVWIERENLINELEVKINRGDKDGYDKLMQDIFELERKENELKVNFYNELKGILSDRQIAQVIVFERNFNREFINTLREMQRERMRRRF
jgi:hypothetical protein